MGVFIDEKHRRVRLLQWIEEFEPNAPDAWILPIAYHPPIFNDPAASESKNDVVWNGFDYTTNTEEPIFGKWKLNFMDNHDAADNFKQVINEQLNASIVLPETSLNRSTFADGTN